jgi:putative transposase
MAKKKERVDKLIDELIEDRTPEELLGESGLLKELTKRFVERALDGELTTHLGYEKGSVDGKNTGNSRNGKSSKSIISSNGQMDIEVPRDRNGDFDPQLIKKRQRRLIGFDEKVIFLYAQGMTVREIQEHLFELYGVEVSPTLISNVTDAVLEDVVAWQNRPLDAVYPIVYLDAIHLKLRNSGRVETRAVYLALGITLDGNKDLLGLWVGESEGAKYWLNILTELQSRGVRDILIACIDGLKGFPEAIESVFPQTQVQLCIVHMIRNSLRYVGWKERKAVARDLRTIYTAATVEAAEKALEVFSSTWGERFPVIPKIWRSHWENIIPFFSYPGPIRKVIYTTNAVESINAGLKKVTKKKGAFPTPDSVRKVLYLAIQRISKKWTRPINNWSAALNYFTIVFGDRVPV